MYHFLYYLLFIITHNFSLHVVGRYKGAAKLEAKLVFWNNRGGGGGGVSRFVQKTNFGQMFIRELCKKSMLPSSLLN